MEKCGVKSKYNADFHDKWAWSLAIKGATTAEIAEAFGVSSRTIERWINSFPSFKESLYNAKNIANSEVEKSLYNRACGYDYEEQETIVELNSKNGEQKPVRIRKLKRHIPPDTAAAFIWLKNRDRENWRDKPVADTLKVESENELIQIYLPKLDEDK